MSSGDEKKENDGVGDDFVITLTPTSSIPKKSVDELEREIQELRDENNRLRAVHSGEMTDDDEYSLQKTSSSIPGDFHPKMFTDSVHSTMTLDPLLIKVIDTIPFQRLRNLKQLGLTYLLYPGASHNRFEHSLGVAHLAGVMLRDLKTRQPELGITNREIVLVQMAGLCHDLGHGPFSHLFDDVIMKDVELPQRKHEVRSQMVLDMIVEDYQLSDLIPHHDKEFVKELIHPSDNIKWKGPEKFFLYQIVSNKDNGIDVDKFDYVRRDLHGLGLTGSFNHDRLIKSIRVNKCPKTGRMKICFYENEVENLYKLFNTRHDLHVAAYQHRVTTVLDVMVSEALMEADRVLKENLKKKVPDEILKRIFPFEGAMRDAVTNMREFVKLTDNVFDVLLWSTHPELEKAKQLCKAVQDRKLFKFVGELKDKTPLDKKASPNGQEMKPPLRLDDEMKRKIARELAEMVEEFPDNEHPIDRFTNKPVVLTASDFVLETNKFAFGQKGDADPISKVDFYFKEDQKACQHLQQSVSRVTQPSLFKDEVTRVYCRRREMWYVEAAKMCLTRWSARPDACMEVRRTPNKVNGQNSASKDLDSKKRINFSPSTSPMPPVHLSTSTSTSSSPSMSPSRPFAPPSPTNSTPQANRKKQKQQHGDGDNSSHRGSGSGSSSLAPPS